MARFFTFVAVFLFFFGNAVLTAKYASQDPAIEGRALRQFLLERAVPPSLSLLVGSTVLLIAETIKFYDPNANPYALNGVLIFGDISIFQGLLGFVGIPNPATSLLKCLSSKCFQEDLQTQLLVQKIKDPHQNTTLRASYMVGCLGSLLCAVSYIVHLCNFSQITGTCLDLFAALFLLDFAAGASFGDSPASRVVKCLM